MPRNPTRRAARGLAALALGLAASAHAAPPVTILVAFPAGGPADTLARVVASGLEKELKTTVVVENKPGGNGAVAASQLAHAAPDGNTLFVSSVGTASINPALYPKLIYDPNKDFQPITLLVSTPEILVVPMKGPRNLAEFLAKARSTGVTLSSSGVGSMPHMGIVQFKLSTKAKVLHVPYKGAAPAITDTMGGQVDGFIGDISGLINQIQSGKLRPIAIAAPRRSPLLPDVPTFDEMNIPNVYANNWYGMVAPGRTPPEKVAELNAALRRVLASSELKAYADATGVELGPMSPQEFSNLIRDDAAKWGKLIKAEGITVDE